MVSQSEMIINLFKETFEYRNGDLYHKVARANAIVGTKAGCLNTANGYISVSIYGMIFNAHVIIFAIHHGYIPEMVDHIDRDKTNNHIDNLRAATKTINAINTGINNNNTSGTKGVYFNKRDNVWFAAIKVNYKQIHLGQFKNKEDAITARKKAERAYWSNL